MNKIKVFLEKITEKLNEENLEVIENKICPILNKDCLREKCQLWIKAHARDFEQYLGRCGLEYKREGLF